MIIQTAFTTPNIGQLVFPPELLEDNAPIGAVMWQRFLTSSASLNDLTGNENNFVDVGGTGSYTTFANFENNDDGANRVISGVPMTSPGATYAVLMKKGAGGCMGFGIGIATSAYMFLVDLVNGNRPRLAYYTTSSNVHEMGSGIVATTEIAMLLSVTWAGGTDQNMTFKFLCPQVSATAYEVSPSTMSLTYKTYPVGINHPYNPTHTVTPTNDTNYYEFVAWDYPMTTVQLAAEYVRVKARAAARSLTLVDA